MPPRRVLPPRLLAAAALLPLLTCALVVPAASAAAADPAAVPSGGVRVAALVERGDGRLAVVHSSATSPAQAQALVRRWRGRGDVRAASLVHPVRALGTPDPLRARQWGLTRLRAEQAWASGRATGELVAVLDTGVDATHPDLAGVVAPGRDLVDGSGASVDRNGHGTHVAGIVAATAEDGVGIAGLATGARILPVRVLDSAGRGYDSAVAQGVLWAVDAGATVINLSLGGPTPSSVLTSAVQHALDRGVVVVAAAGNEGAEGDPVLYPAATPGVLAVGAVDQADARPAFSSTGAHLGVAAPGVGIVSTVPGGHGSWSGTSMAAPFAAAAVAMLQATEPALSPADVVARLVSTAQDVGAAGRDPQSGGGVVDVLAARAAGAPAPSAAADAPAPAPAPLVVRTSRSAAVVPALRHVVIGARVLRGSSAVAGQAVVLERRVGAGPWSVVRRGTTDRTGLVRWALAPDRTGDHRVVVGATVTAPLRVEVRQVVAASVRRDGGAVTVTGRVSPGGTSTVALQVARGSAWATVATVTTDRLGGVRLRRALPPGTSVRLAVAARPQLLAGVGAAVRS